MGRAPCCEKIGLKKGPWTPEEDTVLINFIQKYGHGNWRALPKLAGLLRCGKSCRLRWTNYLRPDIKRGNFTREEEDTIIQLHQVLGNRWSAIAGKLPGRTDNEIKNVWHTHLKKRLNNNKNKDHHHHHSYNKSNPKNKTATATTNVPAATAAPPRTSSSCNNSEEMSSSITAATTADASSSLSVSTHETSSSSSSSIILHDSFPPIIDDTFWSAEVSDDQPMFPISNYMYEDDMINNMISNTDNDPALLLDHHDEFQMSTGQTSTIDPTFGFFGGDNNNDDTMNFWYNIFMGTGDIHLAS